MKRILFITLFLMGLTFQANSQVDYYTDLANEYQREYMINKNKAEKLDSEAGSYLRLAMEYRRLADSCAQSNDTAQFTQYLNKAEEVEVKGQSCLMMAKEARLLYIDQFKLYQDALSKILRARQREQEDLRIRSNW